MKKDRCEQVQRRRFVTVQTHTQIIDAVVVAPEAGLPSALHHVNAVCVCVCALRHYLYFSSTHTHTHTSVSALKVRRNH